MTEQINPGEMPEQKQEAQPVQASAEMVQIDAAELAKMRKALKDANAEAAKYRKTAEQVDAERKAKEEAEMTALDKATKHAAELEARLQQIERSRLQSEIAAKVGLPALLATRLQGETPEELEADAKTILEGLPKPKPTNPGATNPGSNGQVAETYEQKKARLLGTSSVNPLAGGGVIWNYPKE